MSDGHTINIAEGKYFKDDNGNCYFGTVRANDINNKTLQPASQTEYIQYCLGTGNDGSAQHPYTISDANDWNAFCLALYDNDNWNRFSGKIVKLDANISVTRMAGGQYHDFMGTFDGQGHTLTFNYGEADNYSTESYVAPFRNVESGCIIENLHVAGDIYTTGKYAAGIVCSQYGEVIIRNCRSSINIHSGCSSDGTHSGLVANNNNYALLTIEGCVFDGKLLTTNGTNNCGGFVGWDNGTGDMFEYAMVAGHNIDLTTVTYEGTTTASENTWNNLNLDSDYTVVLRRQCSTDHYSQALALEIHTDVACPAPYRLAATNSTATTATLNWSGVQDSYNVRYSPCFLAEGFESGTMPDGWTRTVHIGRLLPVQV